MIKRFSFIVVIFFSSFLNGQEFHIFSTQNPKHFSSDGVSKRIYFKDWSSSWLYEIFIPTREVSQSDMDSYLAPVFFKQARKCVYLTQQLDAIRIKNILTGSDSLLTQVNPEALWSNTNISKYFYLSQNDRYLLFSINDTLNVYDLNTGTTYKKPFNFGMLNIAPIGGINEEEIVFQVTREYKTNIIRYNFLTDRVDTLIPDKLLRGVSAEHNENNIFSIDPSTKTLFYLQKDTSGNTNHSYDFRRRNIQSGYDTVLFVATETYLARGVEFSVHSSPNLKKHLLLTIGLSNYINAIIYEESTSSIFSLFGRGKASSLAGWQWLNEDTLVYIMLSPGRGYYGYDLRGAVSVQENPKQKSNGFVKVCPNPISGSPTVEITSDVPGTVNLELYSVLGELLYATEQEVVTAGKTRITLPSNIISPLPDGVYFLKANLPTLNRLRLEQIQKIIKRR